MPSSFSFKKKEVFNHIASVASSLKILDVGPGVGTYGLGLCGLKMDAIEIHAPYIKEFNLKNIYAKVYTGDILTFNIDTYDYIIMGDVLEHIRISEAKNLIESMKNKKKMCLVAVPFLYKQTKFIKYKGKKYCAESEHHHQADLTIDIMKCRYPSLDMLYANKKYGYYTNYHLRRACY
tara:strand:- start:2733 stop:3266 length:534 start_codon:yes stop_codon:yes gene_type:complete